jgi:hypothetical protein
MATVDFVGREAEVLMDFWLRLLRSELSLSVISDEGPLAESGSAS